MTSRTFTGSTMRLRKDSDVGTLRQIAERERCDG